MIIENHAKRYKIEFIVDTHLSKEQMLKLINAFDGFMIKIEQEK